MDAQKSFSHRVWRWLLLLAVAPWAALAGPAQAPVSPPPGSVTACEHFAFTRASLSEGLGGPALEAMKSWDGETGGTFAPNGDYYQADPNNSIIFRIRGGCVRIFAGDGTRGGRDGPADQARFDFGCGSYSDVGIACDAVGNVYVSEAQAGRLRKIHRKADGTWWVTTVAGGGSRRPEKGKPIPARQMRFGCASRFALTPDGAVYFATYGGIYRVKEGQGTLVVGVDELRKDLGPKAKVHDWHVGGSHITPAGVFYWMPGGGPDLLRYATRTGKAERIGGVGRLAPGLDGQTLRDSGFHTVLIVYSPDASVMYTCGGDESVPRRIADGKVTSLHLDGRFRRHQGRAPGRRRETRWRQMAAVQCLDAGGRLYLLTGNYGWGGWIVRFTFAKENAR